MKIGLIGLGNFGTAIANLIASNGYEVLGWEHNEAVVQEINESQSNSKYLPDVSLNSQLVATNDIEAVFDTSQIIFVALPSLYIRQTLEPMQGQIDKDIILINLAKGIDEKTGLTAFQTLTSLFPNHRRALLSGPSIANEFSRQMPTVVVLAGQDRNILLKIAKILDNDKFRTRFSYDEIGVELGGILKNIYAIGLGMFDGKEITSINFRAAYLTIAIEEMAKIGKGLGAKVETFLYLSGTGDLLATALSEHSHNRRMGELLAQDHTLDQVKDKMGVLPEGYNTLKMMLYIAEKLHISMPLGRGLWDVIHGQYPVERFITSFVRDFID